MIIAYLMPYSLDTLSPDSSFQAHEILDQSSSNSLDVQK